MSAAITAAVVGGVGAAAMANQAEISGRHALSDQQALEQQGLSQEMQMYMMGMEQREPWVEAGKSGLQGYQNLMTAPGQTTAVNEYYAGPLYAAQQQQANQNVLGAASAQGGLRQGSTYSDLEGSSVALGQNYLSGLMNQNLNLANMGMGMAGQNAAGYQQLGQSQQGAYSQMGANTAAQQIAAANAQNQAIGQGIQGLGSAFGSYFNPQGTI